MKKIISFYLAVTVISGCSVPLETHSNLFSTVAIQSSNIPQDKIVFKETFTSEKNNKEFKREFTVKDNTKRYTLVAIKNNDKTVLGTVNINGSNYIREVDFNKDLSEMSKDYLLLNAKNSLLVRIKGKVGNSITVIVFEGGSAGTIKRRTWRLSKALTNESRLKAGDYNIFFPDSEDSLGKLEPYKGIPVKQSINIQDRISYSGVNDKYGNLYIPSSNGKIISYDKEGNQRWVFDVYGDISSNLLFDNNSNLYLATTEGEIYSLDKDGNYRWSYSSGSDKYFLTGFSLDEQGNIYVGSMTGNIESLNSEYGYRQWRFKARAGVFSNPVIDRDRLYISAFDQTIYSFDKNSGEQVWEFQTGKEIYGQTPAIMSNGNIILGSEDKQVFCLDRLGKEQWQVNTDSGLAVSPVVDDSDNIYFSTKQGTLYSVNSSGNILWKYQTEGHVAISPVIDSNGHIYIADNQGYVYSLDKDGKIIFKQRVQNPVLKPLMIDNSGNLIVTDERNNITILETGSTGYLEGAWSKAYSDIGNTGRRKYE